MAVSPDGSRAVTSTSQVPTSASSAVPLSTPAGDSTKLPESGKPSAEKLSESPSGSEKLELTSSENGWSSTAVRLPIGATTSGGSFSAVTVMLRLKTGLSALGAPLWSSTTTGTESTPLNSSSGVTVVPDTV